MLLDGYALAVLFIVWLNRKGIDVEAATQPREAKIESKWKAAGLMVLALAAIIVGSQMLVEGSKTLIERFGLTITFYGMVILALQVSIEEVARESTLGNLKKI